MRKGDVIGGYVLTTDARQGGGGHSQWAFAEKDGTEFFIKRFLSPTYPLPHSPGSAKTKESKRVRCAEFERHQLFVIAALKPISGEGSNLIIAKDFFRDRSHYYKTTSKVEVSDLGPKHIARMPRDDRILVMLTAGRSLETLHRAGLVHGDVKPENLLINSLQKSFAVKVIDFDNCFPAHKPPPASELVGDPAYYSPELLQYIVRDADGDQLDEKNDVFALGLVFWQYLTGSRPELPEGYSYAAEAVQERALLSFSKGTKDRVLTDLILSMLAKQPNERPSMTEVHSVLKLARRSSTHDVIRHSSEPLVRDPRDQLTDMPESVCSPDNAGGDARRLRGKLVAKISSAADPARKAGEGKLRGSLFEKITKARIPPT